ncbi:MAG: hypothetical protein FD145_664 [Candidatus Saganbacteria bacterium]|uniref:LysM peptidoglycan-binding domain-containing protein n=1 Tax=Candidatus Saganbacteria bacterium TaxID=2575572 RepID=A0A833L1H9_UNCSA|nr:MAG: hypothetical protein FD145_664 [Candidatus Saganbacteria bacterium]
MKKANLIAIIFIIIFLNLQAGILQAADVGDIGMGARYVGLGRAYTAMEGDASSLLINPGAIGLSSSKEVLTMYSNMLNEASFGALCVLFPTNIGVIGIGYLKEETGGLVNTTSDETTGRPKELASFSYDSQLLIFGFGRKINKHLSVGANINFYSKGSDQISGGRGTGTSYDIGLLWNREKGQNIGVSIHNAAATGIKWGSGITDEQKYVVKAGIKQDIKDNFCLLIDTEAEKNKPTLFKGAVEWNLVKALALRFGVEQEYLSESDRYMNWSAGVGIGMGDIRFDYAYYCDAQVTNNSTHFVSMSIKLPEVKKLPPAIKTEEEIRKLAVAKIKVDHKERERKAQLLLDKIEKEKMDLKMKEERLEKEKKERMEEERLNLIEKEKAQAEARRRAEEIKAEEQEKASAAKKEAAAKARAEAIIKAEKIEKEKQAQIEKEKQIQLAMKRIEEEKILQRKKEEEQLKLKGKEMVKARVEELAKEEQARKEKELQSQMLLNKLEKEKIALKLEKEKMEKMEKERIALLEKMKAKEEAMRIAEERKAEEIRKAIAAKAEEETRIKIEEKTRIEQEQIEKEKKIQLEKERLVKLELAKIEEEKLALELKEKEEAAIKVKKAKEKIEKPMEVEVSKIETAEVPPEKLEYEVKKGDTLEKIARVFFGTRKAAYDIAYYNNISDPDRIRMGDIIEIPPLSIKTFKDVNSSTIGFRQISYLGDLNILLGYPDGTFKPKNMINRVEFVTMMVKTSKPSPQEAPEANEEELFIDVSANHWATDYLREAKHSGWILGYPDGTFRPISLISRSEANMILYRMKIEEEIQALNRAGVAKFVFKRIQNLKSDQKPSL